MITATEIYIHELDCKQRHQLMSLCEEFQPYSNIDRVVFLEVVHAARLYIDRGYYLGVGNDKEDRFYKLFIDRLITEIKNKFYFNGIKYAKRDLTSKQYRLVGNMAKCPTVRNNVIDLMKYKPAEKELFMKIVRACRDFMRAKMSREAEPILFERLSVVYDAIVS